MAVHIDATQSQGFDAATDFYRQISSVLTYKQFESLKTLLAENAETSKAQLEPKVAQWANESGLEEDYRIFAEIQRDYRRIAEREAAENPSTHEGDDGGPMTAIIAQLASINNDQDLSFKEACRRQNALVRNTPPELVESLGLQNLHNRWCE